ncbi:GDSL-type esterase/lipase family protein [uncultured Pseudodesulfovibrio sp.]|uniref:GDSL-type esterase/lipase family protein n=1 Tax=uncultured Pseudodesulfovibrio sp. TaxID=2035858 RepID=UPI0029C64C27|nr:GDSL-type esterase/lipase family protein [uncultured Pseudodesulfovibrio sp.]
MVICCIGDSLTLGYGDESGLGWPGNITAALHNAGQDVTTYNLGVRKDTTQFIQHRWQTEAALRRLDGQPAKLVFSFGVADIMNAVATEQSLAAALTILTKAKGHRRRPAHRPHPGERPAKERRNHAPLGPAGRHVQADRYPIRPHC